MRSFKFFTMPLIARLQEYFSVCRRAPGWPRVRSKKAWLQEPIAPEDVPTCSVVLLGNKGSGKTALIEQYLYGEFQDTDGVTSHSSTYEFHSKFMSLQDHNFTLEVLDVNSAVDSKPVLKRAMSQGNAFILAYSLTDSNSFVETVKLMNQIVEVRKGENVPIVIVGTKLDVRTDQRHHMRETIMEAVLNLERKCEYFELTCKNHTDVRFVFNKAIEQAVLGKEVKTVRKRTRSTSPKLFRPKLFSARVNQS